MYYRTINSLHANKVWLNPIYGGTLSNVYMEGRVRFQTFNTSSSQSSFHNETQIRPRAFETSAHRGFLWTLQCLLRQNKRFGQKQTPDNIRKRANSALWLLLESIVCLTTLRHVWLALFSQVLLVLAGVKSTVSLSEASFGFKHVSFRSIWIAVYFWIIAD